MMRCFVCEREDALRVIEIESRSLALCPRHSEKEALRAAWLRAAEALARAKAEAYAARLERLKKGGSTVILIEELGGALEYERILRRLDSSAFAEESFPETMGFLLMALDAAGNILRRIRAFRASGG